MVTLISKELKEVVINEEIIDDVMFDLEQFDFKKSETTCPVITIENPEGEEIKYNHKVVIDYSYAGPEYSRCDRFFFLRPIDNHIFTS